MAAMFRRSFLSLLPSNKKERAATVMLDMCFAGGQEELRSQWARVPPNPTEAGFDSLCATLWLCAEQPEALSITHAGVEPPMLPIIIAYLQHASDVLSAATVNAEGTASSQSLLNQRP